MAHSKTAHVGVDAAYGDMGKAKATAEIVRRTGAKLVVLFAGGPQNAHNLHAEDGRQHTFAQIGSGSFEPGVHTHISRFKLVNPANLLVEAEHLRELGVTDILSRITVDRRARVISPFQQAANRLRETMRGDDRHGSCGYGVGETALDALVHPDRVLYARDLLVPATLRTKLAWLQAHKRKQLAEAIDALRDHPAVATDVRWLTEDGIVDRAAREYARMASLVRIVDEDWLRFMLEQNADVVFEGGQGVLLDEWHGFHPYTTWSTTTSANAEAILAECGWTGAVRKIGIIRAYSTRHGAGPFVTEDPALDDVFVDAHNGNGPWQRKFRVGWLDLVSTRYALRATGGVDELAVTCIDQMPSGRPWMVCDAYDYPERPDDLVDARGELIVRHDRDLSRQERLGNLLFRTKPVYRTTANGVMIADARERHISAIQRALGLPVTILSHGPALGQTRFDDTRWGP